MAYNQVRIYPAFPAIEIAKVTLSKTQHSNNVDPMKMDSF